MIADKMGTEYPWSLLFLVHVLSGCDIVSKFLGIGKNIAWDMWRSLPEIGPIFLHLSHAPKLITDQGMKVK